MYVTPDLMEMGDEDDNLEYGEIGVDGDVEAYELIGLGLLGA